MLRGLEQAKLSIAYNNANVKLIAGHPGLITLVLMADQHRVSKIWQFLGLCPTLKLFLLQTQMKWILELKK